MVILNIILSIIVGLAVVGVVMYVQKIDGEWL
jgi:hypothetical protein